MEKNLNRKVTAIVQARINSSRFPGKILHKINGKSVIEIIVKRLKKCQNIKSIIVAIPKNIENKSLEIHLKNKKINYFKGEEQNVLKRFLDVSKKYRIKHILRVTGDCPLIDPSIVNRIIKKYFSSGSSYASNTLKPTYPDGLDAEVFSYKTLSKLNEITKKMEDKEHVTTLIKKLKTKLVNVESTNNHSKENLTLDESRDLKKIKKIFDYFRPNITFSYEDTLIAMKKLKLFNTNNKKRNEGFKMSSGQKFWIRANNVIPGGSMLLSKNSDVFLPKQWPSYFIKSKGCNIWDLDGRKLVDTCLMGIGTNILGYGEKNIDRAVNDTIKKGVMSTLNCPEEVLLAEKLVKMHPWSSMVKFTRSGGEANAVAIRIARAATNREKIAICGYHGWHDWYIAANLRNRKNLDSHLIQGISSLGIPKKLKNTVFPFRFNNIKDLKKIINQNPDLAAVKMEVYRNIKPKNNFLKKVRELTQKKKILLIFDECTSGFRETFGGLHLKYKVNPDIAIFGKSLGNGYAINAIIGKENVMKYADQTFISSTFWTERIGPTAALKTLEIMEKQKSWDKITRTGNKIIKNWKKIFKKNKIKIKISGLPSLCKFSIDCTFEREIITFITQEMLKDGFLANNTIYVSTSHNDKILKRYYKSLDKVLKIVAINFSKNKILKLLDGPVKRSTFSRLN